MGATELQPDNYYWQKLREGSTPALEALYDRYFPPLFRYGLHIIPDRSLVQDTLQDFFVDLYTNHASISEVQQVQSYLFVCFRRKLISRQKSYSSQITNHGNFYSPSYEEQLIAEQLEKKQLKVLRDTLFKLSDRQKEAIHLRFHQEMSYEEIAEVLELKKVKYARTLIYRAIAELRQHMNKQVSSLTLYSTLPLLNRYIRNFK